MAVSQQVPVFVVLLCCLALARLSLPVAAGRNIDNGGLQPGFYKSTCPNAEKIVFSSMQNSYQSDNSIAPGVLRASFHDCFVRGCDCSLLLDGPNSERQSFANTFRQSTYDAIDAAKQAVESACPGIVSCADVLQFAARDAVILTSGQGWAVPAGRRDGNISIAEEADDTLPGPVSTASDLIAVFKDKGLSTDEMVTLTGAHTIGSSACFFFDDRLFASPPDPSLPPKLAASLTLQCPKPNLSTRVSLDATPNKFDSQYFLGLVKGSGLLTSDVALMQDPRTRRSVFVNTVPSIFRRKFADAMVAMSQIDVLTGQQGEIRLQVNQVNQVNQVTSP